MAILLAFAPFIVFAVVERFFGPAAGLIAAALVSAALLVRDWMGAGRTPNLEAGTFLLFGALALYSVFGIRVGLLSASGSALILACS